MAENRDNKEEEKLEFDSAGQAVSYISLDQARVLALRHARDNQGFYGRRYSRRDLIREVVSAEETEDYYEIKLSYRPAQAFRGQTGLEQFTIDKTGPIEFRQVIRQPIERLRWALRASLAAVVALAVAGAVVAAIFSSHRVIQELPS